jgi:hypothetical protein
MSPIYTFNCKTCDSLVDQILDVASYTEIREGRRGIVCMKCGDVLEPAITKANFTLKADGKGFYGSKPKA